MGQMVQLSGQIRCKKFSSVIASNSDSRGFSNLTQTDFKWAGRANVSGKSLKDHESLKILSK